MDILSDYAEHVGLPLDFLQQFVRVATEPEERPGWLAFDYPTRLGGIHQTRYRNPDSTADHSHRWRSQKGKGTNLYNPGLLGPQSDVVWFAEGESDTLTLLYLGVPAVGIPGASSANEEGEGGKRFKALWKLLFDGAFVIVVFDNDQAGQEAAVRAAGAFAPRSAILRPPEGMDVNDWFKKDPDEIRSAIDAIRREHNLV